MQAYLILDIGTGNTRAAVVSPTGEILSLARANSVLHTDHRFKGAQYFVPQEWSAAILRLSKQAIADAGSPQILAVTCSSMREGIVLVGMDGEAIVGYSNADRRGEAFMNELDWERIWELTALSPSPIFSAVKVLGTARGEPEILEKTRFYTSISDWVGYFFTGNAVWERAQAMQSGLYDAQCECWSEELCGIFQADAAKLPPLADAGTVLGAVRPELCELLGIASGAVFAVGTADTQAALAGVRAETGECVIVSGTTSPCVKLIPEFRKYQRIWLSPTTRRGQYMLEVNTASSGINLQRYKDMMLSDLSYGQLNADAQRLGLPERGLPAVYAAFLTGMHLDGDFLTGGFIQRNPISIDLTRESYYHALCLNIGMSITLCLQKIMRLEPLERDYLIGCGGGFSSPVVGQTVADLTGLPIRLYDTYRESTVHGCCLLCSTALGTPLPEPRQLCCITPKPAPELEAYFAQWQHCREQLMKITL